MTRWLWLVVVLSACAAEHRAAERSELPAQPGAAQWIARASESHARADRTRDRSGIRELVAAAEQAPPAAIAERDAVLVRQDLYVHAATLALELRELEQADQLAQRGLALPQSEGPLRRQLFIVSSRIRAARGDEAAAERDRAAARDTP